MDTDEIGLIALFAALMIFIAVAIHQRDIKSVHLPRILDRYFFLALVVSTISILVLYNGIAGSHGNSMVTGIFITVSLACLAAFDQWRRYIPNLCDLAFLAYVACVAVSFLLNGVPVSKDAALLLLTLAAYPAARLIAGYGVSSSFVFTTLVIVAAGAVVTGFELIRQWDYINEKPVLLGTFAAGVNFLISLGFATIAMTCIKMSRRQMVIASAIVVAAATIFAASMVRLAFVAILISLAVSAYFSTTEIRRQISVAMIVVLIAIGTGLFMRSDRAMRMAGYATSGVRTIVASAAQDDDPSSVLPSCSNSIDLNDSIDIRIGLLRDAIAIVKTSGWFGIGLDGFMKRSCIRKHEVHNSFLQAAIEFGWLGGTALVALVALAGFRLLPLAGTDPEARFALCSLILATIMVIGSGRTSGDGILFLFLGFAAGLHNFKSRKMLRSSKFSPV